MVLIPNTTGVESANTNVIGRRSHVAQDSVANITKKYRSNSVTKWRAHWLLKTRCGMLPSNIAKTKNYLSGRVFFLSADDGITVDGVDVMAELEDFFDENIRKRRRRKACERIRES